MASADPTVEHVASVAAAAHQPEQRGAKRRPSWNLLLLPALVLPQAAWMAFLGYLTLRALRALF